MQLGNFGLEILTSGKDNFRGRKGCWQIPIPLTSIYTSIRYNCVAAGPIYCRSPNDFPIVDVASLTLDVLVEASAWSFSLFPRERKLKTWLKIALVFH